MQANATVYTGHVHSDLSTNTSVFGFKIVADISSLVSNLRMLFFTMTMVRNAQVERIFKLSDGQNEKTVQTTNGIAEISNFPELTLIDNRYLVYEDYVIYNEAPPSSLSLPTIRDFDMNVHIVTVLEGGMFSTFADLTPFALGRVILSYHGICSESIDSMGASSFTCNSSKVVCTQIYGARLTIANSFLWLL